MPAEPSAASSDGTDGPAPRRETRATAVGVGLLALVVFSAFRELVAPAGVGATAVSAPFHGVSLGMSADQVRRTFVEGTGGEWALVTACGGPALEWTRRDPARSVRWARFEMHDGFLVAIRAHTEEPRRSASALQSLSAVREDRPFEGGTATTLVSRVCETHAAEAEQLALEATSF